MKWRHFCCLLNIFFLVDVFELLPIVTQHIQLLCDFYEWGSISLTNYTITTFITLCLQLLTPQLTVSHDHAPSSLWVDDINLLLHTQSSNQTPFFKSTLCLNMELFLGFIRLHWVQGGAWRWGSNQWIEQQGLRRPENWHRVVQEIRKVRLQVRR